MAPVIPLLVILLFASPGVDPRVELMEMRAQGRMGEALDRVNGLLQTTGEDQTALGLRYLQGDLLATRGQYRAAARAFSAALQETPALRPYILWRLAELQTRLGHPEIATGLLATLLREQPPEALARPASALLLQNLSRGGDCRLLTTIPFDQQADSLRRRLTLASTDCAVARQSAVAANEDLLRLLREDGKDLTARLAAERLAQRRELQGNPEIARIVGLSLHHHREFAEATAWLEAVSLGLPAELSRGEDFELVYELSRAYFWQARFAEAARLYRQLAERTSRGERRARALYQEARSHELAGDWTAADDAFRRAYVADSRGRFAPASLIGAFRLEWRVGRYESAAQILEVLRSDRRWHREASKAALFIVASKLVRGETSDVAATLALAERSTDRDLVEIAFWRGRLHELEGRQPDAVESYLDAVTRSPYHPHARAALLRLHGPELAATRQAEIAKRSRSSRVGDLAALHWLLEDGDPRRARADEALRRALTQDSRAAAFLELEPVPVREWPLWQAGLGSAPEKLLALGQWREGATALRVHFPFTRPALAVTASQQLAAAGLYRSSVYIPEVLVQKLPRNVDGWLLPTFFRRLLYPAAYDELLRESCRRFDIDPYLLWALIREESRFDPSAASPAGARGLAQFTLPTARRIAATVQEPTPSAEDLERPEVAIELGAAHLRELLDRFGGAAYQAVAAYNAGEPQAVLWQSYCLSRDPAEYLTKVAFAETRNYLERVLASRVQYDELYRAEGKR